MYAIPADEMTYDIEKLLDSAKNDLANNLSLASALGVRPKERNESYEDFDKRAYLLDHKLIENRYASSFNFVKVHYYEEPNDNRLLSS